MYDPLPDEQTQRLIQSEVELRLAPLRLEVEQVKGGQAAFIETVNGMMASVQRSVDDIRTITDERLQALISRFDTWEQSHGVVITLNKAQMEQLSTSVNRHDKELNQVQADLHEVDEQADSLELKVSRIEAEVMGRNGDPSLREEICALKTEVKPLAEFVRRDMARRDRINKFLAGAVEKVSARFFMLNIFWRLVSLLLGGSAAGALLYSLIQIATGG